jgi:uncharacterized surface protein with fasciclin (FAS1) repeats
MALSKIFRTASVAALTAAVMFGPQRATAQDSDIVDIAVGGGSFNTLVAALQAADLVDVLKGDGPFTVFAPTDDAFAALPEGTVESLLLPENKALLASILTYHVVPGRLLSGEVVSSSSLPTVNGINLTISVSDDGVRVNDALITGLDIEGTNGVIHVIDTVIIPSAATAVGNATWGSVKSAR